MNLSDRFDRFETMAREGRIVPRRPEGCSGEVTGFMGGHGKDILHPTMCPREIMPVWAAAFMDGCFYEVSAKYRLKFIDSHVAYLRRLPGIGTANWHTIHIKTLRKILEVALLDDPDGFVARAIALFDRELSGDTPTAEEYVEIVDCLWSRPAYRATLWAVADAREPLAGQMVAAAKAAILVAAAEVWAADTPHHYGDDDEFREAHEMAWAEAESKAWDRIAAAFIAAIQFQIERTKQ